MFFTNLECIYNKQGHCKWWNIITCRPYIVYKKMHNCAYMQIAHRTNPHIDVWISTNPKPNYNQKTVETEYYFILGGGERGLPPRILKVGVFSCMVLDLHIKGLSLPPMAYIQRIIRTAWVFVVVSVILHPTKTIVSLVGLWKLNLEL